MPTIDRVLQKIYNLFMDFKNLDTQSEFDARISLATSQNEILKRMFGSIDENGFNLNIDFSKISSNKLKDFWLYTTGFLGLINYENQETVLSSSEAEDILKGNFCLKVISSAEVSEILKRSGIKEQRAGYSQHYDLNTIQDGKYSIEKNALYNATNYCNLLKLNTNPIEIYTDNPHLNTDPAYLLKQIRNSLAHSVPYINGNTLTLLSKDDEYVVSKMWLRGFAETFCMLSKNIKEETIAEALIKELPLQKNYIENEKDVDKALSSIKNIFPEDIKKNYFRINTFVKNRLNYEPDFYKKPFDKKIECIATILANNPNFLSSSSETINPTIIYNLQQLVAKELLKRGEDAYLTDEDIFISEIEELNKQYQDHMLMSEQFKKHNPVLRTSMQKRRNMVLQSQANSLIKKIDQLLEDIENKRKLECSNMELFNPDSLEKMPVEVAVNLVWLIAFNNLATSGFYEELLANEKYLRFNKTEKDFFSKFNFSKITLTRGSKKFPIKSAENIGYALSYIRNSLCHGMVQYTLPPAKQGEKFTYKDVNLIFKRDQDTEMYGKLIDFYNLFNNSKFTFQRKHDIKNNNEKEPSSESEQQKDE